MSTSQDDTQPISDTPIGGTEPLASVDDGGETQPISTEAAGDTQPIGSTEPVFGFTPEPPAAQPSTPRPTTAPPSSGLDIPRPRLRVGTVVWGLVITAFGASVLATASGVDFDFGLVMIALVGFAGVALLAGSIASGLRHRGD